MILAIALAISNKLKKNNVISILVEILLVLIGIFFIFNYSYFMEKTRIMDNDVMARLSLDNMQEESRVYAVQHNLKMFLKAPIFGIGIKEASSQIAYVADTSTSTYLLSIFGIFGSLYTLYWIIGILEIKDKSILTRTIILVIVLLILNKEPHQNILLTWCFMFWGLKNVIGKGGIDSDKENNAYNK